MYTCNETSGTIGTVVKGDIAIVGVTELARWPNRWGQINGVGFK